MGCKKKRQYVIEQIEEVVSLFDPQEYHLADTIRELTKKMNEYGEKGYVRLWMDIKEPTYEYEISVPFIWGERLENDKEYERRIKKEAREAGRKKREKEKAKERDIQELQRLMKKYPEEIKI